jgi:CBS-domain-containing membrane protein
MKTMVTILLVLALALAFGSSLFTGCTKPPACAKLSETSLGDGGYKAVTYQATYPHQLALSVYNAAGELVGTATQGEMMRAATGEQQSGEITIKSADQPVHVGFLWDAGELKSTVYTITYVTVG